MTDKNRIDDLNREELLELTKLYAKNWLAHDGCWFLALEKKFDMETAIEMDIDAWRQFTVVEAKRLKQFLGLKDRAGISGLKRALAFRLYASLNEDDIVHISEDTLEYRVKSCRVQSARRRKNLADFPCKPVGVVEYGLFAKTIDERFVTEVISCPPEITDDSLFCSWRFILKES